MIKFFFKLIGFLVMAGIISLATILFVPDSITSRIKDTCNSAWPQLTSSQELPAESQDETLTKNQN